MTRSRGQVCTYNEQLGSLPTAPPGFPNRGLVASPGSGGRAYVVSAEARHIPWHVLVT